MRLDIFFLPPFVEFQKKIWINKICKQTSIAMFPKGGHWVNLMTRQKSHTVKKNCNKRPYKTKHARILAFQTGGSLMQVEYIADCSKGILQYFRPTQ